MEILARFSGTSLTSPATIRMGLWGLVFALIAALGYTGGSIASLVLGARIESIAAKPAPPPADTAPARQRKPATAFDPILEANIFRARRSPPGSGGGGVSAPVSIKLTLTGTFILGKVAFAFIIGPDGRTEQVYQLGDCVPRTTEEPTQTCGAGQGKLSRVEADRIFVGLGGQSAIYLLEQVSDEDAGTPVPHGSGAPTGPPRPVVAGPALAPLPSTRSGNTIDMRVPSAEVGKAFENFAEITKQARVVPYTVNGATTGFQIQRIAPGSVFQRIGLQDNDIIKGVNGASVTTADQALRLFTLFRNEREVVLDIQRGPDTLKYSYTIE